MTLARDLFSGAIQAPPTVLANNVRIFPEVRKQQFSPSEIDVDLESCPETVWCRFLHKEHPSFTDSVLADLKRLRRDLQERCLPGKSDSPKYFVLDSAVPGIFNLGGDLRLFKKAIVGRDSATLTSYARSCVEAIHANCNAFDLPIVTISLVRGDALGGGFEAALSSNVLVAEKSAKFGFPEILFNLFPGMGAYNFVARRLNAATAERMIMSGKIYTGQELYDMGLVDVLSEDGYGEETLLEYIKKNSRRHEAHMAIYRAREKACPISYDTLVDIADIWVETAMKLSETDMKLMDRLVVAQQRRLRSAGNNYVDETAYMA